MKTGMLVGAVSLALAAGAQAERFGTIAPVMAPETATSADITSTDDREMTRIERINRQRIEAIGLPGSAQRAAAVADLSARIEAGEVNPMYATLWREGGFAPRIAGPEREGAWTPRATKRFQNTTISSRTGAGGGILPSGEFKYFDGLESYDVDNNPNDGNVDANFAWGNQVNPDGEAPAWGLVFIYQPVATEGGDETGTDASLPDRQILLAGDNAGAFLPNATNPFNPGGLGGYPLDRDPAVEQVMSTGRGPLAAQLGQDVSFFGGAGGTDFDLRITDPAATPTAGDALIIAMDIYFPDLETMFAWDTGSSVEAAAGTRTILAGYNPIGDWVRFLDAQGRNDHYNALGTLPGNFTIGQFFFNPENGMGGTETLTIPTNEWITMAFRMSPTDLQVWVRDSQTDGTNSTVIDADKVRLFENGWAQVYPGTPGNLIGPDTFDGVGVAVNEFLQPADQPTAPLLNAQSVDDIAIFTGLDPVAPNPVVSGWEPSNTYWDNVAILGMDLELGGEPKFILPYRDDIELYTAGALLRSQTEGLWNAGSQADAEIRSGVNASTLPPLDGGATATQSIEQAIQFADSIFRQEYGTDIPGPISISGAPIVVSANVELNDATAGRFFRIDDNFEFDGFQGLQFGVTNVNDDNDGRVYVRMPNPEFDINAQVDPADGDDLPEENYGIGFNIPNISVPTTATVGGSGITADFINIECTIYAEGYAKWTIDGAEVTFDRARIQSLDTMHTNAGGVGGSLEASVLDAANALKNAAATGESDDTVFPLEFGSVDRLEFWSSNNPLSVNNTLFSDDVTVDGPTFGENEGDGPAFSLNYFDDFEAYVGDRPLDGQGTTDIVSSASINDAALDVFRDEIELSLGAAPGGTADFCVYEVLEVIDAGDTNLSVGDMIYAEFPEPGFTCPEFDTEPGDDNLEYVFDATGDYRVGAPTQLLANDGSGADAFALFDRFRSGREFCRYTLLEPTPDDPLAPVGIDAQDNWFRGGEDGDDNNAPPLYDVPAWQVGDVIAVDAVPITNRTQTINPGDPTPCPGVLSANGAGDLTFFLTGADVGIEQCEAGEGRWNITDSGSVGGETVGVAAPRQAGDLSGFALGAAFLSRWGGADNSDGNGFLVDGMTELDGLGNSVDPTGLYGQILCLVNNGTVFQPAPGGEFDDQDGDLPIATASEQTLTSGGSIVETFLDVYVQDLNSHFTIEFSGTSDTDPLEEVPVVRVRLGGPGQDVDDTLAPGFENQILVSENRDTSTDEDYRLADTPTNVPVKQWFSIAVRLTETTVTIIRPAPFTGDPIPVDVTGGQWELGIRTDGAPTPSNASFGDYTVIATGNAFVDVAQDEIDEMGVPITEIDKLQFRQNFGEEGAGNQFFDPAQIVVRAFDDVPSQPDPIDSYCFYEIDTVSPEPGETLPQILDIDEVTGFGDNPASAREIGADDIVALPFASTGEFFDLCPNNANPVAGVEFQTLSDTLLNGGVPTGLGNWTLLGTRNQAGVNDPVPATGISEPNGPSQAGTNARAYNFDAIGIGEVARDIVIADFESFDETPTVVPASRWYVGNFLLRQTDLGPCPDLANDDNIINAADLSVLLANWGASPMNPDADLAQDDDIVNAADLSVLLANWGDCLE